jgi:predicted nucleotidyltransferase
MAQMIADKTVEDEPMDGWFGRQPESDPGWGRGEFSARYNGCLPERQATICRKESTSRRQVTTRFQLGTVGDARFQRYPMLSRNEILGILGANREELHRDFGVVSIALFGSAARGDAGPQSDVDVLVEIPNPISLFEIVALQLRLQELLNVSKVDLVLRDAIFPPLREAILAEALRVA